MPLVVIPLIIAPVQGDQAALHDASPTGCAVAPELPAAAHEPHRRRAGRRRAPGRARGARLRPLAGARTTWSRCRVVSDEEDQERHRARSGRSSGSTSRSRSSTRPYRELTRPVLRYIDELDARCEQRRHHGRSSRSSWCSHWWGNLLHNQSALLLKGRLLFRKGTVVTSVPVPPRVRPPTPANSPKDWTRSSPAPTFPVASLRWPSACAPAPTEHPKDWHSQ